MSAALLYSNSIQNIYKIYTNYVAHFQMALNSVFIAELMLQIFIVNAQIMLSKELILIWNMLEQ